MRTLNYNLRNYLGFFILFIIVNASYAYGLNDKEYEKTITKEFSIDSDALIEFDTRHGNVNIKEGDSNKVSFVVTISTDAEDQDQADDIFSGINIDFDDSSSNVSVTIDVEHNGNWSGGWLSKIFGGGESNRLSYQIDIDVQLPRSVELDIEHSFGDVIIPEMDNKVEVDIRHGSGKFSSINADAIIGIRHGKIRMKGAHNLDIECHHSDFYGTIVGDVDIDISHSDLELDEANEVDIDGSHSDFVFGKVHTLLSDGGFTDFEIDELQNADFDTNFGDIEIGLLGVEGNFDMQHGSVDIDNVSASAQNLDFDVQHTSVYLDLKQDFELDFDGQFAKPKISEELNYTKIDKSSNTYRYIGTSGPDPKLHIEVEIQFGSFKINN